AGSGDSVRSGLRGQLAMAMGDRRTGSVQQMLNLQLIYTGPAVARPRDRVGIGVATTRLNPRAARFAQARDGGQRARAEHVAEVFYGWKPVPGLDVQPCVQYVRHPGGFPARRDAVVMGVKADVRF